MTEETKLEITHEGYTIGEGTYKITYSASNNKAIKFYKCKACDEFHTTEQGAKDCEARELMRGICGDY